MPVAHSCPLWVINGLLRSTKVAVAKALREVEGRTLTLLDPDTLYDELDRAAREAQARHAPGNAEPGVAPPPKLDATALTAAPEPGEQRVA